MEQPSLILTINLEDFFTKKVKNLPCQKTTKAYIISIFSKYQTTKNDLSKKSITLEYLQAKLEYSFERFQNIGDWLFFSKAIFPESLNNASEEYYDSVAQMSYFKCYKIIKQWVLFEELSDRYTDLTKHLRDEIQASLL